MFEPQSEYDIVTDKIEIADFGKYPEEFVVRPPYQRKNVWGNAKQQALLDSLFRRYYIPRLVLREVRLGTKHVVREVVDGQQRITTVQRFFQDDLRLPSMLNSLEKGLGGLRYSELPAEIRKFVDKQLKYEADVIKNIDDPKNAEHQRTATEIFWRLQQGESLNIMETAHARLASPVRNFLVKHADDITFDFDRYQPLDENKHKHPFFRIIKRGNDRMQHLALLGKFLLIERVDGATAIGDAHLAELIDATQTPDGVGDETFESDQHAAAVLKTLNLSHAILKDDEAVKGGGAMPELRREYVIVSLFMLVRHLSRFYALPADVFPRIREFVHDFHDRLMAALSDDADILAFANSRQQDANNVGIRERIIRQLFFQFLEQKGVALQVKDSNRTFNEAERIRIYRRDEGLCQICLKNGATREEALVPWQQYHADHIVPWILGGPSAVDNAQVLCAAHNLKKGSAL